MTKDYPKRQCSAVNKDGQPCRGYAVHDSEPALCAVHGGRTQGSGAPAGNQNALKHGFYAKAISAEYLADSEKMRDPSLVGELVLGRYLLGRLSAYLASEELDVEAKLAVVRLLNSTLRTVAYVAQRVGEEPFDWDPVLDELGRRWGMDI